MDIKLKNIYIKSLNYVKQSLESGDIDVLLEIINASETKLGRKTLDRYLNGDIRKSSTASAIIKAYGNLASRKIKKAKNIISKSRIK